MQSKGISKQDPEANIMSISEGSTTRKFIVCTVHLIQSRGLIQEELIWHDLMLKWKKT
jgi:hypothetical protein